MNRIWDEAVARSPYLFDGPVVACTGLEWQEQELVLSWARATYRYRALRRIRGASGWLPSSLFVTILQPTDGGELAVGRGSVSTAAPGRWQLPGGSAEPPVKGDPGCIAVPASASWAAVPHRIARVRWSGGAAWEGGGF